MNLLNHIVLFIALVPIAFAEAAESQRPSQGVAVVDFDQLESWLHKETDSVYVINFWATWCAPCIREIPDFEQLHETYASHKVKVLLVSLDNPNRLQSHVEPLLDRLNVSSHVILLDDPYANRWIPRVSDEWSGAIPATVIYNKDSKTFYEREFKFAELEAIIVPLIKP